MDIVLDEKQVYLPATEEAKSVASVTAPGDRAALLDINVVDPYVDSRLNYAAQGPMAGLDKAFETKMDQYMPRDAAGRVPVFNASRYSLFPLVFDTMGAWHPLARKFFQAVSQAQAERGGDVWSAGRHMEKWRQLISLTLLREWTYALEKGMRAATDGDGRKHPAGADRISGLALFRPRLAWRGGGAA
jgi:hypothetical protein